MFLCVKNLGLMWLATLISSYRFPHGAAGKWWWQTQASSIRWSHLHSWLCDMVIYVRVLGTLIWPVIFHWTTLITQWPCVPSKRMMQKGQQKLSRARKSHDGTFMVPCCSRKSICREYHISHQEEHEDILKGRQWCVLCVGGDVPARNEGDFILHFWSTTMW